MRKVWAITLLLIATWSYALAQLTMTGVGSGGFGAGASCSFPSLSGLIANWRADTGVTTSGGNVTAVVNQASPGTGDLVNQGTVPFNASSAYNSKPAFDFVSANDAALKVSSFAISGSNISVFVVGRMNSASAVSFMGAVSYGTGAGSDFNTSGSSAILTRQDTSALINSTDTGLGGISNGMSQDANHRFALIYDNAAPLKAHYIDNVQGANTTAGGYSLTTGGTLVIGNRWMSGAVGGSAWQGPILHVVIMEAAATSTERNNLESFFTCQWGSWLFERDLNPANDNLPLYIPRVA